jgi:AraC-like DNA-binding protein
MSIFKQGDHYLLQSGGPPVTPLRFDLFTLLTAASLAAGFVIALALFFHGEGNKKANRIFAAFLLLNGGTIFSLGLSTLTNLYLLIPHVVRTGFLFQLLLSPCLFLYFRFLMTEESFFKPKDLLHIGLPIAYFVYYSPFYFSSADNKIRFIREWFYSDIHVGDRFDGIMLPLPFIIQFTVYLILIFRMIHVYHSGLTDHYSEISRRRVNWGRFMIIGWGLFIFILITAFLSWSFGIISLWTLARILLLSISLFILSLGINALRQPDLNETLKPFEPGKMRPSRKENETSPLTDEEEETEFRRLISHMTSREYWRDPDLTLDRLALKMGFSRGFLSRLINSRAGCSFYDFINGYRIEEVLRLLKTNQDRNILDAAMEAAFNNKSTFYKIFRERIGQTPGEYVKTLKQSILKDQPAGPV